MPELEEVQVSPLAPERFAEVLPAERMAEFERAIEKAQDLLAGRVVWNVNSTARGGGVAEMLQSLIAYARGAKVDARWVVVPGDPDFFRVTKRLHNHLHGSPGDGGALGDAERGIYLNVIEPSISAMVDLVSPDDIVIVHDPQPAALVPPLVEAGTLVVWRCHVGLDTPNDVARKAWDFLRPFVVPAHAYVFSRRAFAWEGLADDKINVIPPSIDAFSPKNQELAEGAVEAILDATGLIADGVAGAEPAFVRWDGSKALVDLRSSFADGGAPPPVNARLVVQVSRWDRLKDPKGVIEGFARYVSPDFGAHLVVAGPDVAAVADDPEGAEVVAECVALVESLDPAMRERIHLANLPMQDGEKNAAIVNALQRHAEIIVQKSLAEGFGLTVAEGMWKARPVVASRIGGIQDQIIDRVTGVLIDPPTNLKAYGEAVTWLLDDEYTATQIGEEAQMRVRDEFLGPRHLMQYVELFARLVG